eukprot:RCo006861
MENYRRGEKLGHGGNSCVYKAEALRTNSTVAMKKVFLNHSSENEVKLLSALPPHPNIIKLLDWFKEKHNVILVFEYLETDLASYLAAVQQPLPEAQVQWIMGELFRGLSHLHHHGILHRDIKPSNILLSSADADHEWRLKISDLGLALQMEVAGGEVGLTSAGTACFQAPELLLGQRATTNVHHLDSWASGCVMAEALLRRPLFPPASALATLDVVFEILGTPTLEDWPGCAELSHMNFVQRAVVGTGLREALRQRGRPVVSEPCLDCLSRLLALNPAQRISPAEALSLPFFTSTPPSPLSPLPAGCERGGGLSRSGRLSSGAAWKANSQASLASSLSQSLFSAAEVPLLPSVLFTGATPSPTAGVTTGEAGEVPLPAFNRKLSFDGLP